MDLNRALQQIEGDPTLNGRFQADPMAVLAELGVDTTNCKIVDPGSAEDEITELSDAELSSVAGGVSIGGCLIVGVSEEINMPAATGAGGRTKGGGSTR